MDEQTKATGEIFVHKMAKVDPHCEHEWPQPVTDMDCCLKCGLSFVAYTFTECP